MKFPIANLESRHEPRGRPRRLNCWEYHRCGRQPGGRAARELGICPAAVEKRADGQNRGTNGGRVCWTIAGTLCHGEVQGSVAAKLRSCCVDCPFSALVLYEEGPSASGRAKAPVPARR